MGTMKGDRGRKRRFERKYYYHFGNSDSMSEGREWLRDFKEHGFRGKVTSDGYGGADVWVDDKEALSSKIDW